MTRVKSAYPHATDYKEIKKNYRDQEGAVITAPRNFTTIPPKKGQVGRNTYIGEKIPYVEDPFDRKKELLRRDIAMHRDKM